MVLVSSTGCFPFESREKPGTLHVLMWIQSDQGETNTQAEAAAAAAAAAKSLQSCLTLCNPIDGSPPGSPVPGILQARTLEWVAISFSNARKWKVKVKLLSCVRPLVIPWTAAHQAPPSMGFARQEYWSGVPLPSPGWNYTWNIPFTNAHPHWLGGEFNRLYFWSWSKL